MTMRILSIVAGLALAIVAGERTASAQRASLYQQQVIGRPLALETNSWLYVQLPPAREVQINDLVTIIVKERQQSQSEGQVNRIQQ